MNNSRRVHLIELVAIIFLFIQQGTKYTFCKTNEKRSV